MKKLLLCSVAVVGALALSGCGAVEGLFSSNPATNAASVSLLVSQATVFVCDIGALASVAAEVETAAQASKSITGTTSKVLAASQVACTGLGAIVTGTAMAPAGTAVIQ